MDSLFEKHVICEWSSISRVRSLTIFFSLLLHFLMCACIFFVFDILPFYYCVEKLWVHKCEMYFNSSNLMFNLRSCLFYFFHICSFGPSFSWTDVYTHTFDLHRVFYFARFDVLTLPPSLSLSFALLFFLFRFVIFEFCFCCLFIRISFCF